MRENKFELNLDRIKIRGRIFVPEFIDHSPAVIILHGIPRAKPAGNDPGYLPIAKELAEAGFLTVLFNFRGTGESEGNFHIYGWSKDLKGVIDWLSEKFSPNRIALWGFSGGGAIAIYNSAKDMRISAVVSASAPAHFSALGVEQAVDLWIKNFREIGLIREPDFPSSISDWLKEFEEIAPIHWIGSISPRPVLIMHGEKDEVVPREHALMLFEKAKSPKELFWVKNGAHRLRLDRSAILKAKQWLLSWREGLKK